MLTVGEPAPWFTARCTANPAYKFDTVAGRYVVLCFFGSAGNPETSGSSRHSNSTMIVSTSRTSASSA